MSYPLRLALVSAFPPGRQSLNEYGLHLAREFAARADVAEVIVLADALDAPVHELELGPKVRVERVWRFNRLSAGPAILSALKREGADAVVWNLQMATFWNISRDQDLVDSMIMGSYERRSAAQDRVAKGWSDAMLGQRDVVTAWGDTIYGVEAGFNRYWTNAVGDVLATDNWLFEPGHGWEEVR